MRQKPHKNPTGYPNVTELFGMCLQYSYLPLVHMVPLNLNFHQREVYQISSFYDGSEIGYKVKIIKQRNKSLLFLTYMFTISKPVEEGFFTLALVTFGLDDPVLWGCPVYRKIFSSITGLCSLDDIMSPSLVTVTYPLSGKITPGSELLF